MKYFSLFEDFKNENESMNFIQTPFNYTGNKFNLLEQLIPQFDYSKDILVDVFTGGGSIYTNVIDKYKKVIANDIIEDLIGIHKGLLYDSDFVNRVKKTVVAKDDKEGYLDLRASYNALKTPEKLYSLMLCCTNNMMRFNNQFRFNQTFGERTFNNKTEQKIENWVNYLTPFKDKITYTSQSFETIKTESNNFYYLDPPYTNTEAGYNAYWSKDSDNKLIEFCQNIHDSGATFVISSVLNDKENLLIKELGNKGFKLVKMDYDYNKVSRKGNKNIVEVIVKNF